MNVENIHVGDSAFLGFQQDLSFMSSLSTFRSMELTAIGCLVNSISRFVLLVKCSSLKGMPSEDQEKYRDLARYLQYLKGLLDNVVGCKTSFDDAALCKECEELDVAINEAREFLEEWSPKLSKILSVLQIEPLIMKIQESSLKITQILSGSFPSSFDNLSSTQYMHEFQSKDFGKVSRYIEEGLKRQREGKSLLSEHLLPISESSLKLTSKEGFLNEFIALEKERLKAEDNGRKVVLDNLNQIIDLLSHIRDFLIELKSSKRVNGGTKVPPYFRCPLSLELMSDPVIVASGQTFERVAIQKWLDHGLHTCPKTHQKLSHTNLTPNYAVKELILNWTKQNKLNVVENSTDDFPLHLWSENVEDHENGNSKSGLYSKPGHDSEKIASFGFRDEEEFDADCITEVEKSEEHSSTHSYVHSRSESASTVVSSNDYNTDVTRDLPSDSSPGVCNSSLTERKHHSSKTMTEVTVNGDGRSPCRVLSFPSDSAAAHNDLTTTSDVEKLIKDLKSHSIEHQTGAAAELRFLAKHNMENRVVIGKCGAVTPLIELLHSDVKQIQEHAVTALLNLSISESVKTLIAEAGPLEPLIHVLKTGTPQAKENAAACLFSLSLLEDYRVKIGRSEAVKALVDLLGSGTVRGKKDAATALFNLSIFHENKARIIQAGAIKHLVELLDPALEMVDKAVALLANLSTLTEGSSAIVREGSVPALVEVVETGSQRGKENAASILLQLCINNSNYSRLVLQEGAVPPLVALSQTGTPRGKEKAQQLLSLFRTQREGGLARRKP